MDTKPDELRALIRHTTTCGCEQSQEVLNSLLIRWNNGRYGSGEARQARDAVALCPYTKK